MTNCIITGGNSGIGFQAALQLAQKGCSITLLCRNKDAAWKAMHRIQSATDNSSVDVLIADLSDLHQVKNAIEEFKQTHDHLHVLINNAADFDLSRKQPSRNTQGIEKQFCTNVLSPYLLMLELLPMLKKDNGRILNISSKGLCAFPFMSIDLTNLNSERSYHPAKVYYQNKLALLTLSQLLRETEKDVKIQAIRVPNVKIDIDRYKNLHPFAKKLYALKSRFSISPSEMAKTYVSLALEEGYDGFLYDEHVQEVRANHSVYDPDAQKKLLQVLNQYL